MKDKVISLAANLPKLWDTETTKMKGRKLLYSF
jgi:hypothetical protein